MIFTSNGYMNPDSGCLQSPSSQADFPINHKLGTMFSSLLHQFSLSSRNPYLILNVFLGSNSSMFAAAETPNLSVIKREARQKVVRTNMAEGQH